MTDANRGYVVVLLGGSACEDYPSVTCVMSVLGPYDSAEARAVAGRQPDWTAPHVLALHRDPLDDEERAS